MDDTLRRLFRERFGERAAFDFPMARLTTWRVGGPAECLLHVRGMDDLRDGVRLARSHDLPVSLLGAGSNLLVRDGGIPGLSISFARGFRERGVRREDARGAVLWAEAGVKINTFLAFAQAGGFAGLEFLAGTPGTMGGAVAMNAGVHEREVKDTLTSLTCMLPDGEVETRAREALAFRYRGLELPEGSVICAADFEATRDDPKQVKARMTAILTKRKATQPLTLPNAGSVFKNPPGDYAGRVIEEAGLRGTRLGGAQVSELHANFIVNVADARAADILGLIELVRERVREKRGVELETEVRVIGVDAAAGGARA
jgi:UDP-N-acetylmuramate dehydrogenase